MMKQIYIFGSGGFAKEVFFLIQQINSVKKIYDFGGFIDLNPSVNSVKLGNESHSVFDEISFFKNQLPENSCFAIGIGNPKILNKIKTTYLDKYEFPNLIHPNVIGHFETIEFDKGNIVTAGCIFTVDVKVGALNIFNLNSTIGHDTIIGNCNVINPGVNISGGIRMGNNNLIGTNACLLQYINIGNNNMIGASAMLKADTGNNNVLVGVPAKVIKENI